ncbi:MULTISPECIES: hypothetical protein [Pseudomonas]|uniref:hypothetical protein n=1 Tax=Pseudomonas TaxID=286 RepID=UPI001F416A77|nr:hypothetical protein [Pseudomonas sputi]
MRGIQSLLLASASPMRPSAFLDELQKSGDSVLIHTAAGGVGPAAGQLAYATGEWSRPVMQGNHPDHASGRFAVTHPKRSRMNIRSSKT